MIKNFRTYLPILLLLILSVALVNCGGKKKGEMYPKAPDWVNKGSGAFKKDTQVFYGVGSATGIQNRPLLTSTADDRARAEIRKIIDTYVGYLKRDYMASTVAGDMKNSSEEQHVEQALKTVANGSVSGAEIVDHWYDAKSNSMYSLCKLDLNRLKEFAQGAEGLNIREKTYIKENAEQAFDRLEDELSRDDY